MFQIPLFCALLLISAETSDAFFGRRTVTFLLPRGGSDGDDIVDLDEGVNVIKKANAVGDPDGEGSSDDEDDALSDWEEFLEPDDDDDDDDDNDEGNSVLDQAVQVEVEEYVEDAEDDEEEDFPSKSSGRRGGVGIRLGQRFRNNRNKRKRGSGSTDNSIEKHLISAWQPHVYYPPSDHIYLEMNARHIEADGKSRLDRRTLYGGLVLELTSSSPSSRRFLSGDKAQTLKAALAMATQPSWRQHSPRTNAIRLYEPDHVYHGCTLAMQETITMAMAHSMGVGVVAIDDDVLDSVRQQLLKQGYTDDDVKTSALVRSLIALGRQGALGSKGSASIASCMEADLAAGLDDPFDERASTSCEEMVKWENEWTKDSATEGSSTPLVIFLRSQQSKSLLKSKAAVDALTTEANAGKGRNLLVIGRGVDAGTTSLPQDLSAPEPNEMQQHGSQSQGMPGSAPWFGFTNHNQNASGQNDPEGSRRFNIFLARTVDSQGKPGIVGAVAPPEAGNLFPHMMAMQAQARLQMQQHEEDPQARAELERWSQMLPQQNMQSNSGSSMLSPQFFNASLSTDGDNHQNLPPPSPEVIQQTLEHAMSELLDKLAEMNEEGSQSNELSPDLQKAFAQVLRNEGLRRGIAENLSRAAPALSDPKCQGVLLSVYVPPQVNNQFGKANRKPNPPSMAGWFQKMLNNQDEEAPAQTEEGKKSSKQKRVRTLAAAAAVMAAQDAKEAGKQENKVDRNLAKLEALCRPIPIETPSDPVRAKSWNAWIQRERGSVVFRQNRKILNEELEKRSLLLQENTGTQGAGSALRQMLSIRPIEDEMSEVITRAVELEAAKSQNFRKPQRTASVDTDKVDLEVDITLSQLCITDAGLVATEEVLGSKDGQGSTQFLHPSSLESALSSVCKISSTPTGGLSVSSKAPVAFRSREDIGALAQDKHEKALVSQVVSPQDIGVSYDMIGGLTEVKELLRQSITYPLKFPHLYSEGIAREAVKGVLLFGPPGTGKTMLAKAVATEGGASFLSVEASSVENKWLGESEKNAKAVFTLARRLAPCVIFIDEVDSLLSSREGSSDDSAHGTLTSVKTTMMSEWDGLNSGTNGQGEAGSDRVVVIGSTNRPFDLDEAVLRRFPRRILVDLPDLETRTEILEVTLSENRLDPSVNLTSIAERLEGYTGSDLKEVCREAVVQISHEQAKLLDQGLYDAKEGLSQRLRPVTVDDFEKALNKLKRSVAENGKELSRVWEWNDQYGEIKKENKNQLPHLSNMYL